MIIQWLIDLACTIASAVGALFSAIQIPASFGSGLASISNITSKFDGLGVWINFPVLATVLLVVVTVYGVSFGIKLFRTAVSYIPFIGGSGA